MTRSYLIFPLALLMVLMGCATTSKNTPLPAPDHAEVTSLPRPAAPPISRATAEPAPAEKTPGSPELEPLYARPPRAALRSLPAPEEEATPLVEQPGNALQRNIIHAYTYFQYDDVIVVARNLLLQSDLSEEMKAQIAFLAGAASYLTGRFDRAVWWFRRARGYDDSLEPDARSFPRAMLDFFHRSTNVQGSEWNPALSPNTQR